ncbi:MAG: DUF1559 domain-containing protein [Gemmataceae bacterium]|nr:DUF1559 domain-containing protein [Gemmataceae bacterium]MDW8244889.1 hypothetical protein [Thermogemmata sp.]
MLRHTKKYCAITLIEFLIAVGIVALLLALLLPAVQKIRLAASVIREKNKVRQICLALHTFEDTHSYLNHGNVFYDILPYLDNGIYYDDLRGKKLNSSIYINIYVNDDDPSKPVHLEEKGASSYAYNALIHGNPMSNRNAIVRDGMSNTVEITSRYARIDFERGNLHYRYMRFWVLSVVEAFLDVVVPQPEENRVTVINFLPPSFACRETRDVLPGSPEAAVLTFQAKPPVDQADYRIPQSPYSHGLLVGMADGSVRMVSPNVSPRTFWAAVSPNGGDLLGPDW